MNEEQSFSGLLDLPKKSGFAKDDMSDQIPKVENLMSEPDVCELFNCTRDQLNRLRSEERLPFLRVTRTNRLYLESDLIEWVLERRTVLNASDAEKEDL